MSDLWLMADPSNKEKLHVNKLRWNSKDFTALIGAGKVQGEVTSTDINVRLDFQLAFTTSPGDRIMQVLFRVKVPKEELARRVSADIPGTMLIIFFRAGDGN